MLNDLSGDRFYWSPVREWWIGSSDDLDTAIDAVLDILDGLRFLALDTYQLAVIAVRLPFAAVGWLVTAYLPCGAIHDEHVSTIR